MNRARLVKNTKLPRSLVFLFLKDWLQMGIRILDDA